jgi:hypothetical protein
MIVAKAAEDQTNRDREKQTDGAHLVNGRAVSVDDKAGNVPRVLDVLARQSACGDLPEHNGSRLWYRPEQCSNATW